MNVLQLMESICILVTQERALGNTATREIVAKKVTEYNTSMPKAARITRDEAHALRNLILVAEEEPRFVDVVRAEYRRNKALNSGNTASVMYYDDLPQFSNNVLFHCSRNFSDAVMPVLGALPSLARTGAMLERRLCVTLAVALDV